MSKLQCQNLPTDSAFICRMFICILFIEINPGLNFCFYFEVLRIASKATSLLILIKLVIDIVVHLTLKQEPVPV